MFEVITVLFFLSNLVFEVEIFCYRENTISFDFHQIVVAQKLYGILIYIALDSIHFVFGDPISSKAVTES